VVVDRDDQHQFAASLLWVLRDRQPADLAASGAARGSGRGVRPRGGVTIGRRRARSLDDSRTLTGTT
jgi:hypothetical protein